MKRLSKMISVLLCIIIATTLCSCSGKDIGNADPKEFRVTSYIVCDERFTEDSIYADTFNQITDIIIFGNAVFDEEGIITLSDSFDNSIKILEKYIKNQNVYLNILGPGSQSTSDDWNEQMYDLADRHNSAFESGVLETSIKSVLEKYSFDGVVFDYEFPLRSKDWKIYDKFILSLRETLGNDYKIGMSMVSWNLKQSKAARNATDFFEVMSYDLWDDDGYHATMKIAQDDIKKMIKKGYDTSKLDLGIPFYARPTTKEAYWYEYKNYYDKMSSDGLYEDDETGLTFSFNTYEMVYDKTQWALANGVGGVMVWHYDCDLPIDNDKSLFHAISNAKDDAIKE